MWRVSLLLAHVGYNNNDSHLSNIIGLIGCYIRNTSLRSAILRKKIKSQPLSIGEIRFPWSHLHTSYNLTYIAVKSNQTMDYQERPSVIYRYITRYLIPTNRITLDGICYGQETLYSNPLSHHKQTLYIPYGYPGYVNQTACNANNA